MSSQLQPRPTFKRSRSDLSRSTTPAPTDNDTSTEELKASLPPFLRQPLRELKRKFEYIQQLERGRHDAYLGEADPGPDHPWAQELTSETARRNRYTDITPWAQSRIHLKVPYGETDYINASPISLLRSDGQQELQYIATQGPKQTGVDHFWQMVWHECGEVAVVVMLTRLNEGAREKCFQYYPSADESAPRTAFAQGPAPAANAVSTPQSATSTPSRTSHSELSTSTQPAIQLNLTSDDGSKVVPGSVTLIDTSWDESSQADVRKFCLVRGDESRIVYHLSFSGWPDFGVPQGRDRAALLNLIRLSDEKNDGEQEESPRIIHCSAGVGRTGTFITLEYLISEINHGVYDDPKTYESNVSENQANSADDLDEPLTVWPDPVFETVARLREQRPVMVQSLAQFNFIYDMLGEEWVKRRKRILEERKQMAEPSPKALRIGRGLKKMLHLGRDKTASKSDSANGQGLFVLGFSPVQLLQPGTMRWAVLCGMTGIGVMYIMWRWK